MNPAVPEPTRFANAESTVFDRVVVGVDGSEPGFEAVRQASRLVAPDGWLELVTALHLAEVARAGSSAPRIAEQLENQARAAIREGLEIAGRRANTNVVNGPPLQTLRRELMAKDATLAVVGTHGHSRLAEIVLGGVAGELLHTAPCSVLFARPPIAEALFPQAIVAGTDGSSGAEAAVAVAQSLAHRFAVPLTVVTGLRGKGVDLERAQLAGPVELVDEHPVRALIDASAKGDILVVGSRGLHGLRALGSVSERVAHLAVCSVLVVHSGAG